MDPDNILFWTLGIIFSGILLFAFSFVIWEGAKILGLIETKRNKQEWSEKYPSKTFNKNNHKTFVGLEIECYNNKNIQTTKKEGDALKFREGEDASIQGRYTAEMRTYPMNGDLLFENVTGLVNLLNENEEF